jgi:hypothetical protein
MLVCALAATCGGSKVKNGSDSLVATTTPPTVVQPSFTPPPRCFPPNTNCSNICKNLAIVRAASTSPTRGTFLVGDHSLVFHHN